MRSDKELEAITEELMALIRPVFVEVSDRYKLTPEEMTKASLMMDAGTDKARNKRVEMAAARFLPPPCNECRHHSSNSDFDKFCMKCSGFKRDLVSNWVAI
jgi:Zn finger protein HypA/HybF involved in hydrogenase expression